MTTYEMYIKHAPGKFEHIKTTTSKPEHNQIIKDILVVQLAAASTPQNNRTKAEGGGKTAHNILKERKSNEKH